MNAIRSLIIVGLLSFLATSEAVAQQWATKMFKTTSHDFGSVAAGAKAEFAFEFQNIFQEDIHVASVRTSCGCTTPRITQNSLKTWEKSAIIAALNTHSFRGQRSATITVVFDRPYYAEVQLTVNTFIRGDVVFEPGEINFGEIDQGSSAERKVQVQYSGRSNWRIVDVRSANRFFEVELEEPNRATGYVTYDMLIRLKPETPSGHFQDQLTVVTDDNQLKNIPLMVQGNVISPITVSPASLFLGILEPGQTVTKNLVVKGKTPFEVECIDCGGTESLQLKAPSPGEKKNVYVIPVTFKAGEAAGQFSQKITIKTSLGEGLECSCTATATVREAK